MDELEKLTTPQLCKVFFKEAKKKGVKDLYDVYIQRGNWVYIYYENPYRTEPVQRKRLIEKIRELRQS